MFAYVWINNYVHYSIYAFVHVCLCDVIYLCIYQSMCINETLDFIMGIFLLIRVCLYKMMHIYVCMYYASVK